jgi:hypothetical protein
MVFKSNQLTRKKCFIEETCAILEPMRGFGFKNRNFWGIFFQARFLKKLFWIVVAKAAP